MERWIEFLVKQRWLGFGFLLAFISYGLYLLPQTPVDALPDITGKQVVINTFTGNMATESAEQLVTFPIENELYGLSQIKEVRSLTKLGLSQVTLVLEDQVALDRVRSEVAQRLAGVQLPNGLKPFIMPPFTGLGEVLMYTLSTARSFPTEKERLMYLRDIQVQKIVPRLKRVAGVADVDTNGGLIRELHINLKVESLTKWNVDLLNLQNRIRTLGQNIGAGYIEQEGENVTLSFWDQNLNTDLIHQLIVAYDSWKKPIYLHQVADIQFDHPVLTGSASSDGKQTLLGTVLMRAGENSLEVTQAAKEALLSLNLPQDIQLEIIYDRSYLIDQSTHTITKNLIEGALLVMLVLWLVLGEGRSALAVAMVIPMAFLGLIMGIHLTGITGNLLSLGAIDFGLVVDGAIVLVEGLMHDRSVHSSIRSRWKKLGQLLKPSLGGLLIITLVYVPILFLQGTEGKLFRPMAVTLISALITAGLLIFVYMLPLLGSGWVASSYHGKRLVLRHLEGFFARLYMKWVSHLWAKGLTMSMWALVLTGLWFIYRQLPVDYIPELNEGDLVIGIARPSEIATEKAITQQLELEKAISQFPEVRKVFSRLGTPESGSDPMGIYYADTFVMIDKTKKITPQELYNKLHEHLAPQFVDHEWQMTQPIQMRFNEILEGSRADLNLRIFGPDLNTLKALADKSLKLLEGLAGIRSIEFDASTALQSSPIFRIEPRMDRLATSGISLQELKDYFSVYYAGETLSEIPWGNQLVPVVLHLHEKERSSIDSLMRAPVRNAYAQSFHFGDLAQVRKENQISPIARWYGQRYSALAIELSGDYDVQSVVSQAQAILQKDLQLPDGYHLEWTGQYQNIQKAKRQLAIIIPLTILILLMILWLTYRAWPAVFFSFSAVPLTLLGGGTMLWIRGINLSVPAVIGLIAASGVAIMNTMVFMSTLQNEVAHSRTRPLLLARKILRARLQAVVTTATVAIFGFLPMFFNTGPGSEIQRPIASVVIGGLSLALVSTLLLLPLTWSVFMGFFRKNL